MEKLFDETYGSEGVFSRTIWYGYIDEELSHSLGQHLATFIVDDLHNVQAEKAQATHWVFYCKKVAGDAIGDKVRSSIMVRQRDDQFICHYNMSDFEFVMHYDQIQAFLVTLQQELNAQ